MNDGAHTDGRASARGAVRCRYVEVAALDRQRATALASLLALAALAALALPMPAVAKPRVRGPLYTISLRGTTHIEWTDTSEGVDEGAPPLGCTGQASETLHFSASASFRARTRPTPLASYGRKFRFFIFKAAVGSLEAGGSIATSGSFAVDPTIPFPPEPSACVFTPKRTEARCAFLHRAELEKGAYFWLSPTEEGNRRAFLLSQEEGMRVECTPPQIEGTLLAGVPTRLTAGAVKALRKKHRLSDARTVAVPVVRSSGKSDGTETVSYRIMLTRVR
jgi:hypothetical protein